MDVNPTLSNGVVADPIIDPNFRITTTVTEFGSSLYLVNARFDTPPTPDMEYEIVGVAKH